METATDLKTSITTELKQVQIANRKLVSRSDAALSQVLLDLADLTEKSIEQLLEANRKDLDRMDPSNPKYDRLLLNPDRLKAIAAGLRKVAQMESPLKRTMEHRKLENGLNLERRTVPLGIIGIVFESRPNVTFDVFALCLKSGNSTVLKGSRDAHFSNLAIKVLIDQVLKAHDLTGVCYLAPSEREALPVILQAVDAIDVVIPRGSQGLINFVRQEARVPVIETGAGIVHTYFDASASLTKGRDIIVNAKSRRVSVCNALDTLLIHRDRVADLPVILAELDTTHQCIVRADEEAFSALQGHYNADLLHPAKPADFGTEFLSMQMSVKTVADLSEALEHIAQYSSRHSEAIIAEDLHVIEQFLNQVDAAVVYANTSTAFTDGGQFGLGAEIGISTQKLHARGPMALEALTSYKWVVKGSGQTRD